MPDIVKINEEQGIIEVHSYGELTKRDMESSIEKVLQIQKERGIVKAVVDTTELQSLPSTIEIYETMLRIPRKLKVAIILDKDHSIANSIRFGETVAFNRGAAVRTFSCLNDAMTWLNKTPNERKQNREGQKYNKRDGAGGIE